LDAVLSWLMRGYEEIKEQNSMKNYFKEEELLKDMHM
jgi:hypothetical protein